MGTRGLERVDFPLDDFQFRGRVGWWHHAVAFLRQTFQIRFGVKGPMRGSYLGAAMDLVGMVERDMIPCEDGHVEACLQQ